MSPENLLNQNLYQQQALQHRQDYLAVQAGALTRPMFMELLVRLAQVKYIKANFSNKFYESLHQLLDSDGIQEMFKSTHSPQKWRENVYYSLPCQLMVKEYYPFFEILYSYYAQSILDGNKNIHFEGSRKTL